MRFCSLESVILRIFYFASCLRNLVMCYELALLYCYIEIAKPSCFKGECVFVCFAPALLLRGWYIRSIYWG